MHNVLNDTHRYRIRLNSSSLVFDVRREFSSFFADCFLSAPVIALMNVMR